MLAATVKETLDKLGVILKKLITVPTLIKVVNLVNG
jgi:hypothetical protein